MHYNTYTAYLYPVTSPMLGISATGSSADPDENLTRNTKTSIRSRIAEISPMAHGVTNKRPVT